VSADQVIPPAARLAGAQHDQAHIVQVDGYRVTAPQFPMTGLACWRIRSRVGRDILPGQASIGEEVS
jgi:hypothetical protein